MVKIQAGYFVVNGISPSENTYQALPTDKVNIECWVIFDKTEVGNEYKAELKIVLPTGREFSYYTPLIKVNENQLFDSEQLEVPMPIGKYSTTWFVVYDKNGNTITSGHARGLNCENLIVIEKLIRK